jgi:phosphopantothenoylcysteine synthetase/decarboxylase
MRVIVTCGPSYEPIDEVRRITNFSTGELGLRLTRQLRTAGHEVICFRGEAATWHDPATASVPFSTNDDLLAKLGAVAATGGVDAVFHAAALADFRVERPRAERKIASRAGELILTLVPATKLLGQLRGLFPSARIVGWKYELDDTREDALAMGRAQITNWGTDACVVNGIAYGAGYGFLSGDGTLVHLIDKAALCNWLVDWL